jgi:hypothetical protein
MKRITVDDLEKMTTHQIADLLANLVLVLRRMPDVPAVQLQPIERPPIQADKIAASVRQDKNIKRESGELPDWLAKEAEE